ncbi:MAG: hypothetical protein QOH01_2827 [Verrucomicrobiota bacterium]
MILIVLLIPVRRVTRKIMIRIMSMSRNKQSDKTTASRR